MPITDWYTGKKHDRGQKRTHLATCHSDERGIIPSTAPVPRLHRRYWQYQRWPSHKAVLPMLPESALLACTSSLTQPHFKIEKRLNSQSA